MSEQEKFRFYAGDGQTIASRNLVLPPFKSIVDEQPSGYLAGKSLRDAVNVAIMLGQPLLVTGEPGSGKTQLAASIAYELGDLPLLKFNTKSTSTAKDLFYRYDALRHFHDAQFQKIEVSKLTNPTSPLPGQQIQIKTTERAELTAEPYITYEALGLAILLTMPVNDSRRALVNPCLHADHRGVGAQRSVVLIDEIDKAPRDLPNDILYEIEQMSFEVKEISSLPFKAETKDRPIVILTSNSEKNLPDAFLRRCVFYHIDFPNNKDVLGKIVETRLGSSSVEFTADMRERAIEHFLAIRNLKLRKNPATAELLGWIRVLERIGLDLANIKANTEEEDALIFTYSILAKNKEDRDTIIKSLHPTRVAKDGVKVAKED
jgi:MoxR-like ATPase